MGKLTPPKVPLDLRGLRHAADLFRLSGASRRDAAVDLWLAGVPIDLRAIAQRWFFQIRQCGEDVLELMHDGGPVGCVGDAPFAYVNSFKSHVNVGFFWGVALKDPAGLLEGRGKRMRHVKIPADGQVNASALANLIEAAYSDIQERLVSSRLRGSS